MLNGRFMKVKRPDFETGSEVRTMTLTAKAPETRVELAQNSSSTASLYWQSGDKILVLADSDKAFGGAEKGSS